MAGLLKWEGGENVYGAGMRNVSTLYEYWLFFELNEPDAAENFKFVALCISCLSQPTADCRVLFSITNAN